MAAAGSPATPAHPPEEPQPPDFASGIRRFPEISSSPDGKKDREAQQAKKRVRPLEFNKDNAGLEDVIVEDITEEEEQEDMSPEA
ncbi:unnamed protein product [Linum trigynum]|uniref:Uncharacterized protein n=1 Tax=Linum trigynum TaxID=586398 RepID=A0AAV2E0Y6_9ROSI